MKNNNPGPGAYEISKADKFTKQTSQISSIHGKWQEASNTLATDTDAGFYDPHKDFGKDCKKYTFGKRRAERSSSITPPPGAYNTNNGYLLT